MNAIPADADGWVAPGLWAGIRAVRGGAGTALVGSYDRVARLLGDYRDAGVDLVIGSGYPHREEVGRVGAEVWPRIAGARRSVGGRRRPDHSLDPSPPGRADELAERFGTPLYAFDGARLESESRAFQAVAGPDATIAYSVKSNPLMGLVARLHRAGCWAEVASGFEYGSPAGPACPGRGSSSTARSRRGRSCGAPSREGATVIADGAEQVREIARLAAAAAPGRGWACGWCRPTATAATGSAWRRAPLPAAASLLARAGLPLTGLHIHLGAYQLGPLPPTGPPIHGVTVQYPVPASRFAAAAGRLSEVAARVGGIEWLDLGAAGRRPRGWRATWTRPAALGPGRPPPDPRARPGAGARRRAGS